MIKDFINKYFDYIITASYLERIGWNHFRTRHIRKYFPRCFVGKIKKRKRGRHK